MKIFTVQEKFDQAPEKIQEIVMSVETSEILYAIEKKYDVYKEENNRRILPRETTKVLVGVTHPKDFVPSLVEKLDVPKERAQEIAKEVNQKIFSQVKDLLIELHGLNKTQTTTAEAQPYEIKVPQKPEVSELRPEVKKNYFDEKLKIPSIPPIKIGAIPPIPIPSLVPQAPRKDQSEVKKIPIPMVPPSRVNTSEIPVPKPKNEESFPENVSPEFKNPFEEKLRQTFAIPPKDPFKVSVKKEISEEEAEREAKKEAVTKDPYLETPE